MDLRTGKLFCATLHVYRGCNVFFISINPVSTRSWCPFTNTNLRKVLTFFYDKLQEEFWTDPNRSISKAYERTDQAILTHNPDLGRGGSTAVTAILINGVKLWIANVGDSRGVLSKRGQAIQMTTDHEPNTERDSIEDRGGFVSNMPGSLTYP